MLIQYVHFSDTLYTNKETPLGKFRKAFKFAFLIFKIEFVFVFDHENVKDRVERFFVGDP